jgi:hypothetical protein
VKLIFFSRLGAPALGPVPAVAWIPVAVVLGITLIVILPVVLTLPESYSCSAKDGTYYVKTIGTPGRSICFMSATFLRVLSTNFYIF